MKFQNINNRPVNHVQCVIGLEDGCNAMEGEYSLYITSFLGSLVINQIGGVDDISLIKECIENEIDFEKIPNCSETIVVIEESGEWEDVFWNKYYKVIRVNTIEH